MKTFLITVSAALLALGLVAGQAARADSGQYPDGVEQANDAPFTAEELDELLAPIALYPDPLLAQILPAATFADQIDLAARYMTQYGPSARIGDQPWDVSVKAVAHYPGVLSMMDQRYDWTVSLGQAYINQPQDVMDAIQRLRAEAEANGNLGSTPEQQVVDAGGVISIDPAAPDMIYVPQYDPLAVYVEAPSPGYGFITFGTGFLIGAWLNRDCDWHGRRIYYHGWQGGGWIGRARLHVRGGNSVYIDNRYRTIAVNRGVLQHDTTRYRGDIRRNAQLHPAPSGRAAPPAGGGQGVPARGGQGAQAVPGTRQPALPASTSVYRGRDVQKSQPASQTGYGGYGSGSDAAAYRQRGQSSRGTMQQFNRQAPAQRPAASGGAPAPRAVSRPAPAPRSSSGGGGRQKR
jgi:hypothetical protein